MQSVKGSLKVVTLPPERLHLEVRPDTEIEEDLTASPPPASDVNRPASPAPTRNARPGPGTAVVRADDTLAIPELDRLARPVSATFAGVIQRLMDPADAIHEDEQRPNALAMLNASLAWEGGSRLGMPGSRNALVPAKFHPIA